MADLSATITGFRPGSETPTGEDEYDVQLVHVAAFTTADGEVHDANYLRTVQVSVGGDPSDAIRAEADAVRSLIANAPAPAAPAVPLGAFDLG